MGVHPARAPLERLIRIALIALAALLPVASATAARQPDRIVAVGDLHGDYAAWQAIAHAAGLVDPGGHWTGGRTTLVQLGDVTDRGADSLKIIRNLQQLAREAPRSGGKVVVILGNHEAMNLLGDNRYTTPGEYAAFAKADSAAVRDRVYDQNRSAVEAAARAADPTLGAERIRTAWMSAHPLGWVEHRLAWGPAGELGRWATSNPAVMKIGDTLFVHGGISAEYAKLRLPELNRRVAQAMAHADDGPASILNNPLGPLWYRGLVARDADAEAARAAALPTALRLTAEEELNGVLAAYNARRLVVGHTPDLKGIEILYGGKLVRADTGISRVYGGPLSWLEIVGDRLVPHRLERSRK